MKNFVKSQFENYYFYWIESYPQSNIFLEMALVDSILMLLSLCTGMKPKQFFTMYTAITGEGKAEQFKKVFESGMMSKSMITLTCLYVQNKDNFMV